ncbi:MAG: FKBP-type peptidyl-prolyl cis-trans isomerase [Rubrivivax sp.]|nr:FKBP-type peptidyl-prolyl cis-trans isomerase [Rubrivivax sp.]
MNSSAPASPPSAVAFTRRARALAVGLALALPAAVPHAQTAAASSAPTQDALAAAAAEKGAQVTASGLVYRSLQEGQGESPAAADTVRVHYRGRFPDGREFDSSYSRGQPTSFPLNRVIRCWTEGVQKMKVGGKAKLTCPAAIAYGERGAGGVIPPNAVLQFEVELLGITKAPG